MSATKLDTLYGLFVKEESPYGTVPTFANADAVITTAAVVPEYAFLADGARPSVPGGLGPQRRARPTGRSASASIVCEMRGAQATYTGSVFPPDIHALLKASGHSATFSAATWTYAPQDLVSGLTSVSVRSFVRGEQHTIRGGMGSFAWAIENGVVRATFAMQGIGDTYPIDDASTIPTISYGGAALVPPSAEGMSVSIGSWVAPIVRTCSFDQARALSVRGSVTGTSGVAGIAPALRAPRVRFTVEATALVSSPFNTTSGINPMELLQPSTAGNPPATVSVAITVGGTANNRFTQTFANSVLVGATPGSDNGVATWDLEFEPVNGAYTLVFN
jgi:hypothetical protein